MQDVALHHLKISSHVMRQRHRLRFLQMSEARHVGLGVLLHDAEDRPEEIFKELHGLIDLISDVEPHVQRDLVVTAAPRVKLLSGIADALREHRFDERVDILILIGNDKLSRRHILLDALKAAQDLVALFLRQDPLLCEHGHMRAASAHILRKEALIETDRLIEFIYKLVRLLGETASP